MDRSESLSISRQCRTVRHTQQLGIHDTSLTLQLCAAYAACCTSHAYRLSQQAVNSMISFLTSVETCMDLHRANYGGFATGAHA